MEPGRRPRLICATRAAVTPKLMKLLQDRFAEAEEGEQTLVETYGGHTRRTLEKAINAAGVEDWEDRFRALRRSCE